MPLLNTFNSVSVRGFAAPPIPGPSGPVAFVALNRTVNTYSTVRGLDNGNTWTAGGNLPGANLSGAQWYSVATNGSGQYVAARIRVNSSGAEAAYSNDGGNTWTAANLNGSRLWTDVAYGNGVYIAISGNSNSTTRRDTSSSADGGQTWTFNSANRLPVGANTPTANTNPTSYRYINYGNGVFIATAINSNCSIIARSTDNGANWSAVGVGSLANTTTVRSWGRAVSNGSNRWVMTNYDGSNRAAYSTDNGQTWTTTTNLPIITAGSPLSNRPYYDMAYGNGVWVASNWGNVAVTTDGTSWTTYSTAATGASIGYGIAYSNGVFAIAATGSPANVIITSSDNGQTWTKRYDLPSGFFPFAIE